jgi:hypothetical protein
VLTLLCAGPGDTYALAFIHCLCYEYRNGSGSSITAAAAAVALAVVAVVAVATQSKMILPIFRLNIDRIILNYRLTNDSR